MTIENIQFDPNKHLLSCRGEWNLNHLPALQASLEKIIWPDKGEVIIDGKDISLMDSAGAWLILQLERQLKTKKLEPKRQGFKAEYEKLIQIVAGKIKEEKEFKPPEKEGWFAVVGRTTLLQLEELRGYLSFVGQLTFEALRVLTTPRHWRWNSLASAIYLNGYLALPIIALLSFMIGVVLTYQMGLQLKNYGANIYIVDLIGLAVLREFGPLLTAIMVAGRTGSSYTAQLGIMKINQEVDALNTMGVTPAELLLLPRILGLVVALPLLTIWADVFGIVGGMVMANNMLNITWYDFLQRFPHVVPLKNLIMGLGKAPVFALIIASIGCYEGMKVEGSASSVGRNTTKSVVLAIFFIIVADAIFSIIFSKLKL